MGDDEVVRVVFNEEFPLTDAELAGALAQMAGDLLLSLRTSAGLTGKALSDLGDRQSDDLLLKYVAETRPSDAVLSEETADTPARLSAGRVWIIDPLDGSREYGMVEQGRTDWAVHVALWERGLGLVAAAVAQPALGAVYRSDTVATEVPRAPAGTPLRFLVSDSRPPAWATPVAAALGAELVPMGSAGAKGMAVVRGDFDAYLHDGGQWEWDSAAPVGVALAAGLHASRVDGSPLVYNEPHPYLPDLLICRPELADSLLAEIAAAKTA